MEQSDEKSQSKQFLGFLLDNKNYGFPILEVDGIIGMTTITPIPQTPVFAKGVINLRGQIIPIIDLGLILGMEEVNYNEQTCIIIVKIEVNNLEKLIGFIVDTVSEVFDIPLSEIATPPSYGDEQDNKFITGIGKVKDKLVMLLDLKEILETKNTSDFLAHNFEELENSTIG